jgi:Flp pilus assembly protein TadD
MTKTIKFTGKKDPRTALLYCFIIATVTFISFSSSLNDGFTNWDDDKYVTNNPYLRNFSIDNVKSNVAFKYGYYQPLTMLSYMVEFAAFQLHPLGYHLANILLHCINALLVFALINGLTGRIKISLLVSLLFALHPLRVESVAWISERKDVLSSLFYFLSLLSYVRYLKKAQRRSYWSCMLFFVLSLLSKPMAISGPLVLLLIDYLMNKKTIKINLSNKIPFFAVAAVCAILTYATQKSAGAIAEYPSLWLRMCVPFYGMLFYIVKTIVPMHLSAFYPFPTNPDNGLKAQILLSPLLTVGIASAVYYSRTYSKKAVFGALFFLVTIAPVIQIVLVGKFIVAERYTYIPLIGLYFVCAEGLAFLYNNKLKNSGLTKKILPAGLCVLLFVYACITYQRCGVWKDSLTLWNDVITKYPVAFAYNHRGVAYHAQADYTSAIRDYSRAIMLEPAYAMAYNNRGLSYQAVKNNDGAIKDFTEAIKLDPTFAQSFTSRGIAYHAKGDYDRAISDYTQAIALNPKYVKAYLDRGAAFQFKGDYDQAISDYSQAILFDPRFPEAYTDRGLAYYAKGDDGRALDDLKKACGLGYYPACKLIGQ